MSVEQPEAKMQAHVHVEKGPTIQDVMAAAHLMKAYIYPTGAVDFEPEALDSILQRVQAGQMTPQEGLQQIHKVEIGRYDYH